MTDEIFKWQEERERRGRGKGLVGGRKENQENPTRLWYKIKSPWTRHKRKANSDVSGLW